MGYLLLEGGAEFNGRMIDADRRALELAGGEDAAVDIIPAAAAPDSNHHRAGQNGVEWFRRIGALNVVSRLLIDRDSAENQELAEQLRSSRLVFLLGGFPSHLAHSLMGTYSWRSICSVYLGGGVIGGSSAGAMVLCEKFYDPFSHKVMAGLSLMAGICLIPHHNSTGFSWVKRLCHFLPELSLLGIDEETGIINDALDGGWTVYGSGTVVLYHQGIVHSYAAGAIISYEQLPSPQVDLMYKEW